MCILAAAGRPRPGEIAALILSLGLLAFYAVPDPAGMAFPAVLSLWLPAARGAAGLSGSRSIAARIAAPACMAAVAALDVRPGQRVRLHWARPRWPLGAGSPANLAHLS